MQDGHTQTRQQIRSTLMTTQLHFTTFLGLPSLSILHSPTHSPRSSLFSTYTQTYTSTYISNNSQCEHYSCQAGSEATSHILWRAIWASDEQNSWKDKGGGLPPTRNRSTPLPVASFPGHHPGFRCLQYRKSGRGPGIIYHVRVERLN